MKKLFAVMAAMLLCLNFTSCSDDDDAAPDNGRYGNDESAVFPKGYDASKVDAWFSGNNAGVNRALYLFQDGSYVLTGTMTENGKTLKGILSKGSYTVKGDFNNGSITISPTAKKKALTTKKGSVSGTLIIVDGKIIMGDESLYIRDTKDIPAPEEIDLDITNIANALVVQLVPVTLSNTGSTVLTAAIANYTLLELDASKLTSCGFVIDEQQTTPTVVEGGHIKKIDNCAISEKGIFMGTEDFHSVDAIVPVIRAFVIYDGQVYYSSPYQTTPNGGGEEEELEYTQDCIAYLPLSYSDKKLSAWYSLTQEDKQKQCKSIEAVFLFSDKTLVVTKSKIYAATVDKPSESRVTSEGTYTIKSGNLTNGKAEVTATVDGTETTFEVTISNGILSAMDSQFTKQDNASAPVSEQE